MFCQSRSVVRLIKFVHKSRCQRSAAYDAFCLACPRRLSANLISHEPLKVQPPPFPSSTKSCPPKEEYHHDFQSSVICRRAWRYSFTLKAPREFAWKPCAAWEESQPIPRSSDNGWLGEAVVSVTNEFPVLIIQGSIITQSTPTVSA
jgi:hypothetical protein